MSVTASSSPSIWHHSDVEAPSGSLVPTRRGWRRQWGSRPPWKRFGFKKIAIYTNTSKVPPKGRYSTPLVQVSFCASNVHRGPQTRSGRTGRVSCTRSRPLAPLDQPQHANGGSCGCSSAARCEVAQKSVSKVYRKCIACAQSLPLPQVHVSCGRNCLRGLPMVRTPRPSAHERPATTLLLLHRLAEGSRRRDQVG